jgi:hypothetical protein
VLINMKKSSSAAAAIRGDADAYANPCVAGGRWFGDERSSSRAPSRRGVRGEPGGGGAPVALDRVHGLRQEQHHIIQ